MSVADAPKPSSGPRTETDAFGPIEVPGDRYWGAQTQRSRQNFQIGDERVPQPMIRAMALVKKAAALANLELGRLDQVIDMHLFRLPADHREGFTELIIRVDPESGDHAASDRGFHFAHSLFHAPSIPSTERAAMMVSPAVKLTSGSSTTRPTSAKGSPRKAEASLGACSGEADNSSREGVSEKSSRSGESSLTSVERNTLTRASRRLKDRRG